MINPNIQIACVSVRKMMGNNHKMKSLHIFGWKKRLQFHTIYWNELYIQHRFNHYMEVICFSLYKLLYNVLA